MTPDERLDLEFAYVSYGDSCKDVHSPAQVCRREFGHADEHACGFGAQRRRWPNLDNATRVP